MAGPGRLFCFGLGYCAQALGRKLIDEGWTVAGTCRSEARRGALTADGFQTFLFDRDQQLANPSAALAGTTHLLASVPPDQLGDPVLDAHTADIGALESLTWIAYLSTTGVYGNHDGHWVDENTVPSPTTDRSRWRLAAEQAWRSLEFATVQIFRLAGIYGPGRNQFAGVRAGTAQRIDKPEQVFSRVHVADITASLTASMARPHQGRVYNLCDDEPAPSEAVVSYACELLGQEPPPLIPFESAELSPMARSFYRDNRRVSNDRIKDELGVRLRHPNYRSGLKAILDEEK